MAFLVTILLHIDYIDVFCFGIVPNIYKKKLTLRGCLLSHVNASGGECLKMVDEEEWEADGQLVD